MSRGGGNTYTIFSFVVSVDIGTFVLNRDTMVDGASFVFLVLDSMLSFSSFILSLSWNSLPNQSLC